MTYDLSLELIKFSRKALCTRDHFLRFLAFFQHPYTASLRHTYSRVSPVLPT